MTNLINDRISIDPRGRFGKPAIKGPRIAVSTIVRWLDKGETIEILMIKYD